MLHYSCAFARVNPDPAAPICLTPGSPEKIELLRLRAALGLPLFLEGDRPGPRQWGSLEEAALLDCFSPEEKQRILTARSDGALRRLAGALGADQYLLRLAKNILRAS